MNKVDFDWNFQFGPYMIRLVFLHYHERETFNNN